MIEQAVNRSGSQSIRQSIDRAGGQSIWQSIDKAVNRSSSQSIRQAIDQAVNRSGRQSIRQSIDQAVNRSGSQSIRQSIDQAVVLLSLLPPLLLPGSCTTANLRQWRRQDFSRPSERKLFQQWLYADPCRFEYQGSAWNKVLTWLIECHLE